MIDIGLLSNVHRNQFVFIVLNMMYVSYVRIFEIVLYCNTTTFKNW